MRRLLRIVAMPVALLVNVVKGLWFLLCALSDVLWDDAFGGDQRNPQRHQLVTLDKR